MDQLAIQEFSKSSRFSKEDVAKMSRQERAMRWRYLVYCRMRAFIEPLNNQTSLQILAARSRFEAEFKDIPAKIRSDASHFPQAILSCRGFERRVRFLQTIESLRDYASHHQGRFPAKLEDLTLLAPNDPFTEKPFLYEANGKEARLRQESVSEEIASYDYVLTFQVGR